MNVFKRIAEIAQSRFLNTESTRSGNNLNEEDELRNGIITPQNVFRAPSVYAPQRRLNAVTRYVTRRDQIILNTIDSTEVEEIASTSAPPINLQSRNQNQRHSFQIQVCILKFN